MAPNEVLLKDGKPKGFTRTHRGYLQQREDSEDEWVHAVHHNEIRRVLIHNAACLGTYRFPPRGGSGLNVTSFHSALQDWGSKRADRAPLLFQLEKIPAPSAVPENMMVARQVVLDQNDHRILDFPELPATLSTKLEGHHIELFLRQNDKIDFKDLIARMPEPTPGLHTLKVRVQDFRLRACCLTWPPQQVCQAMNAQIERLLGPVCFLNNSSRPFGRDFNSAEVQSILEGNNRDNNKRTRNNKGKARQESPELSEDDESDDDNEENDGDTVMANTEAGQNTRSPAYSDTFTMTTRYSRRAAQVSPSPSPASKQLLKELTESTQPPTKSAKESPMSSKPPAESSKSRPTLSKPVIGSRISKPEARSSSKTPAKPSKKSVRFQLDKLDDGQANPKDVSPNDSDGLGSEETERENPPPSPSIEELMNPGCVPGENLNPPPRTQARTVVIPGWDVDTQRMPDGSIGPTNFNPNLGFGMNVLQGNSPVRSPPEQQPQAPTQEEQDNQVLSDINVWKAWDHEMAKDDWYRMGGTFRPPPSPPRFSHPNLTFEQNMMVDSPSPSLPVRQNRTQTRQQKESGPHKQTSSPQEMVLDDVWKTLKGEMFDEDIDKLWADRIAPPTLGHSLGHEVHMNLNREKGVGGNVVRDTGGNVITQPEVRLQVLTGDPPIPFDDPALDDVWKTLRDSDDVWKTLKDELFGDNDRWYEDRLAALGVDIPQDLASYLKSSYECQKRMSDGFPTHPTIENPPTLPANKSSYEQSRDVSNGFPTFAGDSEQMTSYKWLRSQAGCYPGNMDVNNSIPTYPADVLAVRQSVLDTWGDNVVEEEGDTEREKFLKWMRSGGRCYVGGDDVVEEVGDSDRMKFFKWMRSRAKCYPGSKGSLAWWKVFSGSDMSIRDEVAKGSSSWKS